jgi:DNA-binding MarR family transcriptional regulator
MDASRSLGYTLHHLSFVLDRQSDLLLQDKFNIGFSQFKIMMALLWHEGVQQSEIADFLGQTEASVSRQVKLLIDQGLVTSRLEPTNRRKRITRLSPEGERVANEAMTTLEMFHAPMFEKLTERQQSELREILEIMHDQACSVDKLGSCVKRKGDKWKK